jgi:hypothetical protein
VEERSAIDGTGLEKIETVCHSAKYGLGGGREDTGGAGKGVRGAELEGRRADAVEV